MIGAVRTTLDDLSTTARVASAFAAALRSVGRRRVVIDLRGPLGSGKTAFVRALATALGLPRGARVTSPTFTLLRTLPLESGPGGAWTLHHLDAYRLGGVDDLEAIGFLDLLQDEALVAVEWGDRVIDALGEDHLVLELCPAGALGASVPDPEIGDPRELDVTAFGPESTRLLAAWEQQLAGSPGSPA